LAATYRGLCTGCTKTGTQSILLGCPLLLHLWSYEHLPVGQPIAVPRAGGGVRPSRQADHGVDVVPPPGSYFELTSFFRYLKVMQFVKLTHSVVCSSLVRSRPGDRTWTSLARSTSTPTMRLSSSHTLTPWSPHLRRVSHPCAFGTVTSGRRRRRSSTTCTSRSTTSSAC
jgi:hypothetical protein